jgi:putative transposase
MSGLCREFGISRKTGYKIYERYRDCGVKGLTDRSRRPYRHANQLPFQIETLIVRMKREKPAWGAPKIRERLSRLYPEVQRPAISTVHAVLDRHGLVKRRKRRRNRAMGTPLSSSREPNALVRGLQGRVHARRPVLLLPADHQRLRQPLFDRLRGARQHQGGHRLPGF